MKFILLAATALIAAPLAAQTTPAPADSSATMPADQTMPAPAPAPADQAMPAPADQAMPAPAPMPADPSMPAPAPMGAPMADGTMTAGGYAPGAPAMMGQASPGVMPVFKQAPTPTEAFPPPAPLQSYPVCKKGQYDQCMQKGGR